MTIDRSQLSLLAVLLLPACSPGNMNSADGNSANAANDQIQRAPRIRISANYDATLLPGQLGIDIHNEEAFPVCFLENDLLPGSETTTVRDANGQPLSGSSNSALEEFRGINVAGPVVVLRPGKLHSELVPLEQIYLNRPAVIFQIGFGAFPCRALFDGGSADVRPTFLQKVFRLENGRLSEQPELRFQIGEEPPPPR